MDRTALEAAIDNSGGVLPPDDELVRLLAKIARLEQSGRFGGLLGQLTAANDRSNFLATLLEVTFAFQFEDQGLQLAREIKQTPTTSGSVDFRRTYVGGHLDMELRLVQQDALTTEEIRQQLANGPFFAAAMGASDELRAICRAQNIILSKAQNPSDGAPVKFAAPQAGVTNIVVVDTHDLFLGGIDVHDCRLITYGDPEVAEEHRRGAFGLFQQYRDEYGATIRQHYDRFAHARTTVHGVMFLFRTAGSGVFDYGLRQHTFWNRDLMDAERGKAAITEIQRAIPFNGA